MGGAAARRKCTGGPSGPARSAAPGPRLVVASRQAVARELITRHRLGARVAGVQMPPIALVVRCAHDRADDASRTPHVARDTREPSGGCGYRRRRHQSAPAGAGVADPGTVLLA